MTATADAIVERVIALVSGLAPTSDATVRFRAYRNEGNAAFDAWADGNPDGAHRRFHALESGAEDLPEYTDMQTDMRHFVINVRVAYPQSGRYGGNDQAVSRAKVIDQDWGLINGKIGIYGRSNFTGAYDCTPLGASKSVTRGSVIDMLEITATFSYYRVVT